MLQAYVDDSGSNGQPLALLAGFVSTAERWAAFSDEWRDILQLHPTPRYFKANEACACRGQFDGWGVERRDERLKMLRETIKRHVIVGISSIIDINAFSKLRDRGSHSFSSSPYWLLYYKAITTLFEWQRSEGICEPTQLVFDEQGGESSKANLSWDDFGAGVGPYYGAMLSGRPIHGDDITFLPLQAADFLAWFINRSLMDIWKEQPFGANQILPYMEWEGVGIYVTQISDEDIGHICRSGPENR